MDGGVPGIWYVTYSQKRSGYSSGSSTPFWTVALRASRDSVINSDGKNVVPEVWSVLDAIKGFSDGTYDEVKVVFSEFVNAATQKIEAVQYLPVSMDSEESDDASSTSADYIFEPNQAELLDILIPKILRTTMFRFMLDTNASEHGARMVAMEQATENANELLRDLKLQYNRERQAAITNEILEIVGGAAALEEG